MIRIISIFTFFIISKTCFYAQIVSFDVKGSFGQSSMKFANEYFSNYNDVHAATLSKPLKKMVVSGGYSLGLSMHSGIAYLGIDYEETHGHTSAKFTDEALAERHFGAKYTTANFVCGYENQMDNILVCVGARIGQYRVDLDSYQRFKDGVISYDWNNHINGKFKSSSMILGLDINLAWMLNERLMMKTGVRLAANISTATFRDADPSPSKIGSIEGTYSLTRMAQFNLGLGYAFINNL